MKLYSLTIPPLGALLAISTRCYSLCLAYTSVACSSNRMFDDSNCTTSFSPIALTDDSGRLLPTVFNSADYDNGSTNSPLLTAFFCIFCDFKAFAY